MSRLCRNDNKHRGLSHIERSRGRPYCEMEPKYRYSIKGYTRETHRMNLVHRGHQSKRNIAVKLPWIWTRSLAPKEQWLYVMIANIAIERRQPTVI